MRVFRSKSDPGTFFRVESSNVNPDPKPWPWLVIRENLNDREGQPAYTYNSHLLDTSVLYSH